jgi:DnaA-homolog protein
MRQLILDLLPESPPTLDNFVPAGNAETLAALTGWLANTHADTSFCLWGELGSGCTHLSLASGLEYIDAALQPNLNALPDSRFIAIDHVDQLSADGQGALFNLFNRLKASGGRLLTASPCAPAHLAVREDLRTRLGSGLIYRLLPLSDADKAEALAAQAQERALKLDATLVDYLMRHAPRDMRTLSGLIVALDRYTLEHKRPVTLPLLRDLLNETRSLDLEP